MNNQLATPVPKVLANVQESILEVSLIRSTNPHVESPLRQVDSVNSGSPISNSTSPPSPTPSPTPTPTSETSLIPLYCYGEHILIFDDKDMRKLTVQYGISGQLSGTLPLAPQQNTLLGYPFRLSIVETIWCLKHGIAELIDGRSTTLSAINNWCNSQTEQLRLTSMHETALDNWRAEKRKETARARAGAGPRWSASTPDLHSTATLEREKRIVFMETPTAMKTSVPLTHTALTYSGKSLQVLQREYKMYSYLRRLGHSVLNGMRFGGSFVAYPGDPLRYHAHQVVDTRAYATEDVDLFALCNRARLATGVRKVWVVGGDPEEGEDEADEEDICSWGEGEMVCFSVEWAGF
ncbi:hypothetical protein CANINC_000101 [Pichia inconspicua]|uniref:tRNA-splicing endonuclease subunit Sen34 n=1 Tax=Pichia inconspicua TaxID=52247 RepID=A0A4T0X7F7_9ASCO|nr:hypothetical protein CANINC_000101 [[Candida] inconspicua]